jgi:hypothetical protein
MGALWEKILGPDMYKPALNAYRKKLRSSKQTNSAASRETPRFLQCIATNDYHCSHLQGESGCVVALKWDVVKEYAGSMATVLGNGFQLLSSPMS